jgi:hypothetical protein
MIIRTGHPGLTPGEPEIAVSNLTRIPDPDITAYAVIAMNTQGDIHFASGLPPLELALMLISLATDILGDHVEAQ